MNGPRQSRIPRAAARGDEPGKDWDDEFETFYRTWTKPLVAFLVVQGADAALAADLVQQAMITLYRRWPEVVSPRPWMFRTVSRDLVRAMSSVRESPTDEQGISPLLRPGQSGIEHWERRDDLMMQIRRLAPRQRQVMAWTMFEYTPTEIASELNLTPQAVRSILYQARNALIKAEAGQGEAADE